MLDTFLNHKIPSTLPGWTDELIRIASIFSEFDGEMFDYKRLTERFETISKRLPDARDSSDYRDEYGAYGSYLGLMGYERSPSGDHWIYRVNKRAQALLCNVLPDPEAYMRMQLALFQYPNPIGCIFYPNGTLRVEHSSLRQRIDQIKKGVKTSPFRLFLRVLIALAEDFDISEAHLTYPEIWSCLFTQTKAVGTFDPNGSGLAKDIMKFRRSSGKIRVPKNALRNLHIMNHTGLMSYRRGNPNRLLLSYEAADKGTDSGKIARALAYLPDFFPAPASSGNETIKNWTREKVESGEWASYFSGSHLDVETAELILRPLFTVDATLLNDPNQGPGAPLHDLAESGQIRKRRLASRKASPEETQILQEKANLQHREIVSLLGSRLTAIDAKPQSNIFIDVAADMKTKKMLFEVKSCNATNLLSQTRKGVSQLYEYRYRHDELRNAKPVLVLGTEPTDDLHWLIDYLIRDRGIAVCWLEADDILAAPSACSDCLEAIVHRLAP